MKIKNQHGDLLLQVCDGIPKDAKRIDAKNGYVLERGEGVHTHIFPEIEGVEIFEKGTDIYVRVSKKVFLDHEEHGKQAVMPGIYKKSIERVWDYEGQESRKVVD